MKTSIIIGIIVLFLVILYLVSRFIKRRKGGERSSVQHYDRGYDETGSGGGLTSAPPPRSSKPSNKKPTKITHVEEVHTPESMPDLSMPTSEFDDWTDSIEQNASEEADATVFSPRQVSKNSNFLIQVFIHSENEELNLDDIAKAVDAKANKRISQPLLGKVEIGDKIDLFLVVDELKVDPATMRLVWKGKMKQAVFEVEVPPDFHKPDVIGKVVVSVNTVPVGTIRFKIEITDTDGNYVNPEYEKDHMRRFNQAFISYCSKDRREVLKRVQMLNSLKCKYFQDLLSLEAGDKWEEKIYENLKYSDVVFLMWSKAASESPWVRKEILYALDLQKESNASQPEIVPIIIEGPPPAKPPEELKFLHFNDRFMYFINSAIKR